MAQGGHLKRDVPRILDAIRQSRPGIAITLENAMGEVPEILDVVAAWVVSKA
jgi:sirohydrochlorin cobaltochelatase